MAKMSMRKLFPKLRDVDEDSLLKGDHERGADEDSWIYDLTGNCRRIWSGQVTVRSVASAVSQRWKVYGKDKIKDDIFVGVTLAGLMLPQAVAYSYISQVPPNYGLNTAFIPYLMFGLFGTNRFISFGPFAICNLIHAAALESAGYTGCSDSTCITPTPAVELWIEASIVLTFIQAITYWILSSTRLTMMSTLLADPVMGGFVAGAAILIGASQLKYMFGLHIPATYGLIEVCQYIVDHQHHIVWWNFLVCVLSSIQILGMKDLNHRIHWFEKNKITLPVHLITMICWIFITWLERLDTKWQLGHVGAIAGGLPKLKSPNFSLLPGLIAPSLSVSIISFVIGVAVVKKFAQKYNEKEKMGRQIGAMGIGAFVGSFTSCYPPCASLIRAAIIDSVGPASPFHCIITASLLGIVMLCLTGVFKYLPTSTLAAVIVTTLPRLIDLPYAQQLYRKDKRDFFVWITAFLVTALHGVSGGILVSVALSFMLLVLDTARPNFAQLARVPGSTLYREIKYFKDLELIPNTVIVSIGSALTFTNKDFVDKRIRNLVDEYERANPREVSVLEDAFGEMEMTEGGEHAQERQRIDPPIVYRYLIIDCSSIYGMDSSAGRMLQTITKTLYDLNWRIILANVHVTFAEAAKKLEVQEDFDKYDVITAPDVNSAVESILMGPVISPRLDSGLIKMDTQLL